MPWITRFPEGGGTRSLPKSASSDLTLKRAPLGPFVVSERLK
jgi:hypothetical protein